MQARISAASSSFRAWKPAAPAKMRFHTSQRASVFFALFWPSAQGDSEVCGAIR